MKNSNRPRPASTLSSLFAVAADVTVTISSPTPGAAFTASAVLIDNASNAPTTGLPQ